MQIKNKVTKFTGTTFFRLLAAKKGPQESEWAKEYNDFVRSLLDARWAMPPIEYYKELSITHAELTYRQGMAKKKPDSERMF
jgi:hypothetical protein